MLTFRQKLIGIFSSHFSIASYQMLFCCFLLSYIYINIQFLGMCCDYLESIFCVIVFSILYVYHFLTAVQQVVITGTSSNTTTITVTWNALLGADGFTITCSEGTPSPSSPVNDGSLTQASCVGVTPGGNHSISIVTLENAGQSSPVVEYVTAGNYLDLFLLSIIISLSLIFFL